MDRPKTAVPQDRLALAALDAADLLDISRAQFFKLHAMGKIPRPVRLGSKAPRWRVDELKAWLAAGCPDRETWETREETEVPRD